MLVKQHYITEESNSVCVWDNRGKCVFTISRYADNYTGYEQAVIVLNKLNKEPSC